MINGNDVVSKAREYLGSPFHHQGRLKNRGIDCGGLIVCVLEELGIGVEDIKGYARAPDGNTMRQHCDRVFIEKEGCPIPGDILLFWILKSRRPMHLAFFTDYGIIHSYAVSKKVVEHGYTDEWKERLIQVYRPRHVEGCCR